MKRLIVVAIGNEAENTIRFKVVNDSMAALRLVEEARETGLITVVGAINYQYSKEKAYTQLRATLRKKVLEKVKAKI